MKKKLLFVCLGNICRSPAAEAIAQKIIDERGLHDLFYVDSAGIHGMHHGEPADRRMSMEASKRDYNVTSISRPVTTDDYDEYDLLLGMDDSNIQALYDKAPTLETSRKIIKMADYLNEGNIWDHIPDPYYGGQDGFTLVLDLLEEAIGNLIEDLSEASVNR